MTKQELRQQIRQAKKQHTTAQLQSYSTAITRKVLDRITTLNSQLSTLNSPLTLLLYHSLPDEVCTHDLIRTLHAEGHTILLPTVQGDDLTLHVYLGDRSLATGTSFGIQESLGPLYTDYSSIQLALIPGMAFTPQGARLGRGRGYYDRLLPRLSCPLIGLAFPFQILPHIPTEPHDILMTEVITA